MKEIVEVAVGLPVFKTFHYRIPEKMRESLQIGMRVLVPIKGRKVTGFSIDLLDQPPEGIEEKLREVEDLLDEAPLIDPPMLHFYRWISNYYLYPLGEVIKTGLPPGLQLKSELILTLTQDGMEGKEVKPKFEKMVQYQGGEPGQPISKKQAEILKYVKEKGEISYSELSKRFKSPSKSIQSLQAKELILLSRREVCRDLSVRSELKPYPN